MERRTVIHEQCRLSFLASVSFPRTTSDARNGPQTFLSSTSPAEEGSKQKSQERPIRIMLADDHEAVRRGLRAALAAAGWQICGEATNGQEAIQEAARLKPDLIILDVSMPIMNGLEAARMILRNDPGVKIVAFTMHESQQIKDEMARIGVQAHATKSAPLADLLATIRSILSKNSPSIC